MPLLLEASAAAATQWCQRKRAHRSRVCSLLAEPAVGCFFFIHWPGPSRVQRYDASAAGCSVLCSWASRVTSRTLPGEMNPSGTALKKREGRRRNMLLSFKKDIQCNSLFIGVFVVEFFLMHYCNFCTFSRRLDNLDLDFYDTAVIHKLHKVVDDIISSQIKGKLLF